MRPSTKIALVPLCFLSGALCVAGAKPPATPAYRVDVAGMDRAVRPGDDFFRFANGGWLKVAEIPADRAARVRVW